MLLPPLFLAALIIGGACDFQLLEPLELPRWGVSLTIPLINRTYSLSELIGENDATISMDKDSVLQIEYSDTLQRTEIEPGLLEVELPASASRIEINESQNAPNAADFFTPVSENVHVVIALDSLLESTGLYPGLSFPQPLDFKIPPATWNNYVTEPPVSPVERQEGPFEVIDIASVLGDNDFIKAVRYVQLSSTATSEFVTSITTPDFPTPVDSIRIEASSGSYFNVVHDTASLGPDGTFSKTTPMQSDSLGSELALALRLMLPDVTDTVTIPAGDEPRVEFDITLAVGGVDSLAITTARTSLIQTPLDPLSLPSDIEITSGLLRSGQTSPINEISLTGLRNTLPFDISFQLTFPNFDSPAPDPDSLTFGSYTLSADQPTVNDMSDLGGYIVHNPAGNVAISEFEYVVVADVLEQDVVLGLDGESMGTFQATFGVGDLYFESITGNFSISFDAVNTTIQNIPTGFAGFEFGRLSLILHLYNQIKLPVQLDLRLVGRTFEGDPVPVPISAPINYPDAPDAPANNGDTAYTMIILDESSVRTYWLPEGITDTNSSWWDTTVVSEGKTIVDVLNLPPDIIEVAGAAVIEGEGVVEVGKGIWGGFELIAPFAFFIPQDVSFLPVAPIPLAPMAEDTREQIRTALLSASLTSRAQTNCPIGGKISMLAADTTLFTLALDYLDDIVAGIPTVYASLDSVLAADSIFSIDQIVFYPESPAAGQGVSPLYTRAKKVEFYTTGGDTFWIGHLFDMEIPLPKAVNDRGWVTTPGDTTQVIALDAERIMWLASDTTVYLKTFITLYGADGIRTIQSTNWIKFAAFITFNLASDIFSAEEEPDSSEIEVQSIPTMTLVTSSDTTVYLDSVFTPPEGVEVKDLDLAATTSHAGIATATIRTIRTGDTVRKVLRVTGIGPGIARITVSADDDLDDDIDPVTTSFLVTVQPAVSESISPLPLRSIRHKVVDHPRLW